MSAAPQLGGPTSLRQPRDPQFHLRLFPIGTNLETTRSLNAEMSRRSLHVSTNTLVDRDRNSAFAVACAAGRSATGQDNPHSRGRTARYRSLFDDIYDFGCEWQRFQRVLARS